ncbi:hypothetical protein [Azospirillum isscasi]|uniref:Uncharacterized protein n=1 Tax=Azospirillum isscasi TaxID=3053926 RepID=A0ABU0WQW1_9PROT|nr:hypothetical protein [Azospirillum isscasi]MDQ2106633.1 hypothetical protein [Azospirillum isscasi]
MNAIAACALIALIGVLSAMSVCAPAVLTGNKFLQGFINHELIATLGVIMSITIASASQIHLALNQIEERRNMLYFSEARREIAQSSYLLITFFLVAIILMFLKEEAGDIRVQSFIIGLSLTVLAAYIIVLYDIVASVFAIGPILPTRQSAAAEEEAIEEPAKAGIH